MTLSRIPKQNAEILKDFKVDVPQQTQTNVKEQAQENKATETQAQKPTEEQAAQTEQPKYHAIDESKIDWTMLKEKWGIDRDQLESRATSARCSTTASRRS